MQAPPATMYCGRCGAPLADREPFCGRCGTPVAWPQPVAQAVAQPAYSYPQGPPVAYQPPPSLAYAPPPPLAYPTGRQFKLSQVMIAGGLVAILLIVALVVGGIAVAQFAGGSRSACTTNCAPKFVAPLPEEASYRSSAFKFQVNYSPDWTVRTQSSDGITLGTKVGTVQVVGMSGGTPDQVLQQTVSKLPTSQWQDVALVANLKGAHIGEQDGIGAVYSANFVGTAQTATKVRFAVITASERGVTVVVFAVDPADPKNSPNGMPEGQAFDYLCTEFVWG
jgi:hypothetical protein